MAGPSWFVSQAAAQTVPFAIGNSVVADGLKITLTGCTVNGTKVTGTGACGTNLDLEVGTGRGANIDVVSATTGGSIASVAAAGSNYDLVYTLSVAAASGAPVVSYAATTLTGTQNANVSLSDTLLNAANAQVAAQSINLASAASVTSTNSFASTTALSVTTTLQLTGVTGTTLKLSGVAQGFSPAPEPLSIGVFAVGLAGLGFARRRRGDSVDRAN